VFTSASPLFKIVAGSASVSRGIARARPGISERRRSRRMNRMPESGGACEFHPTRNARVEPHPSKAIGFAWCLSFVVTGAGDALDSSLGS